MTEIETWTDDAISLLGLCATKLGPDAASQVRDALLQRFIAEKTTPWWWSALAVPATTYSSLEHSLSSVLPSTEGVGYLIPETEDDRPPVYELRLCDVQALIEECPFFEYYVAGPNLDWLLIESHHNEFFVANIASQPR